MLLPSVQVSFKSVLAGPGSSLVREAISTSPPQKKKILNGNFVLNRLFLLLTRLDNMDSPQFYYTYIVYLSD